MQETIATLPEASRGLSPEQVELVAGLLDQLEPGFLPYPIFRSIARLVTTPTVEFVPVRLRENAELEVLMTKRGKDDPDWPDLWAVPGTVLDSKEAPSSHEGKGVDLSKPYSRILNKELFGHIRPVGDPVYVTSNYWRVERGTEFTPVFYFVVEEELDGTSGDMPQTGQFFPIASLPDNTIHHHKVFLQDVGDQFLADIKSRTGRELGARALEHEISGIEHIPSIPPIQL